MSMSTMQKLAAGVSALLVTGTASAAWDFNMPKGVTEISHEVWRLHMLIFGICTLIAILVFGVMIYSMLHHRKSKGFKAAQFHHSTTAEIVWTIIPFFILIGMAIPAAGTLIKMEDFRNTDMTIKITGYQWKWQYTYIDEGIDFFSTLHADSNRARQTGASGWGMGAIDELKKVNDGNYLLEVDNPLVVPVGKKIRFLLTSNDVLHAWWAPDLAIKKDAIPGYINEMWTRIDKPGTYRGQCVELCGRDHGFMPVVVKAVSEDEYKAWVAQQKGGEAAQLASAASEVVAAIATDAAAAPAPAAAPPAEAKLSKNQLMAKGKETYDTQCAACHKPDGSGMPPTFPAVKGSKVVNGPVAAHLAQIIKGKGAMPPFGALSDEQIAAVVTYQRNALGNSTGDVVQPAAVKAAR
ncbi:MAG: cytochrome c oxidase subunit II [Nevskiales bacterium]